MCYFILASSYTSHRIEKLDISTEYMTACLEKGENTKIYKSNKKKKRNSFNPFLPSEKKVAPIKNKFLKFSKSFLFQVFFQFVRIMTEDKSKQNSVYECIWN